MGIERTDYLIVNPHDSFGRETGLFIGDILPTPIAIDIVGTVVKLGSNVSRLQVGDHIFGNGTVNQPDQTGTQEYATLLADFAAKIPTNVSADEAATYPLNALTLFFAMFHAQSLDMPPPYPDQKTSFDFSAQKLVIIGGGSATGKYGIQFAKLAGIGTIITVASKNGERVLKSLGATHVIDRHASNDEIEGQVREIVGDELIYVVDCIGSGDGGQTLGAKLLSNSKKGTLVCLIHAGSVDDSKIGTKKAGYEMKKIIAAPRLFPAFAVRFWRHLPQWIEEGRLKPTTFSVIDGLDAEKVNAAFDAYRDGRAPVKPHVHIL